MQRDLPSIFDGDTGTIVRFEVRDGAVIRDLATAAVECYLEDEDGNSLGMCPGFVTQAKSTGLVDIMLKGSMTDYYGAGENVVVIPKFYYAQAPAGGPATNVLLNSSFDTYTGGTGVADNWTQGGTLGPMVFEVRQDDPAPPTIFGKCQRLYTPTTGSTAYIAPTALPSISLAAGDWVSGAMWTRAKLDAGANIINYLAGGGYFIRLLPGGSDSVYNYLIQGDRDWKYETVTLRC